MPDHLTTVPTTDDLSLALHRRGGDGAPLVCVPGGPMLDVGYLGDLGGLATDRPLALLDPRGTGASERPADLTTCRCDRQADDLEAVRHHLGVDRLDLIGHSAGANVVYRYVERHPRHAGRLLLVTPSVRGVSVEVSDDERSAVAALRAGEAWYPRAASALAAVQAGAATDDDWRHLDPLTHGRWDDAARAYAAAMDARRDDAMVEAFAADGAFDPPATDAALARHDRPVLVLAGEVDGNSPPSAMARVAALFADARLVVQAGAGHFPWFDDPAAFRALAGAFAAG